mgnify:FL=1
MTELRHMRLIILLVMLFSVEFLSKNAIVVILLF